MTDTEIKSGKKSHDQHNSVAYVRSFKGIFSVTEDVILDSGDETIKIEVLDRQSSNDDGHENITDIQNYLQTFNKEIQTVHSEAGQGGTVKISISVHLSSLKIFIFEYTLRWRLPNK